jgi:aromatic-L-amino-acid decarboxylase
LEKIQLDQKGGMTMVSQTFRKCGHTIVDWIADYMDDIEEYPVLAQVEPGEIRDKLPQTPPEESEEMGVVFDDFKRIILPGITHWQHPSFFAYFPANTSEPSILAEFLTAALGAQWVPNAWYGKLLQLLPNWRRL